MTSGAVVLAASCTGECQKSGPLGLALILLLCVACYFLFKSMSKHLRRVREQFPYHGGPGPSGADPSGAGPSGGTQAAPAQQDEPAGEPAAPAQQPPADSTAPDRTTEADST